MQLVMGHSRNTLHTSTCFHRLSNKRPTMRWQSNGNLTVIYGNLLYSAIFCQVHRILLSSARTAARILFCPVYVLTKQLS